MTFSIVAVGWVEICADKTLDINEEGRLILA